MGGVRGGEPGGRGNRAALALVLAGALAAVGCTSSGNVLGSSEPAANSSTSGNRTSFSDRMNAFFFGAPANDKTGMAGPTGDIDCPTMDIRSGASTFVVAGAGAGADANATNLRYQANIARASRECALLGATLTIKVGVQGRVLLGPAGTPGQVEVPLRLALVQEGLQPKTIWTKFYRVPVTIPPGQTNVPFVQIEEDLTVPTPSAADLDSYIIYVGFDPAGKDVERNKRPPAKKPKASR